MRVIVTGGLGQIGSHIAELLIARGDEVLCIDNLQTGRVEHLESAKNLKITHLCISEREKLFDSFAEFRPDAVVHTAALLQKP